MRRLLPALLLAVAGCATPEPLFQPVQPLPASFFESPATTVPVDDWWSRLVAEPAIAELVRAGLANAPDLEAATARIEAARAPLRATEAERRPALRASAGLAYSHTAREELGFAGAAPEIDLSRTLLRAGLEASWDADLFGRLRANERAARARLDAAGFDSAAVRIALVTDIARNFVAARSAAARQTVARADVETARALLALARHRVEAGLVRGIHALEAEALLSDAEAALPPLASERAARTAAIATLTGLAPERIHGMLDESSPLERLGAPVAGVPSDLLLRRPDVAAAFARVAAADADIGAAIAARYPRLRISGVVGLVAASLTGFLSGDALGVLAGPEIAGSLFDGGRSRAQEELARAHAAEEVADYRKAVLQAFGEAEAALAAVAAGERRLSVLERQVALQSEAASVALVQHRQGIADFSKVLEARRSLLRSEDRLTAARAELLDSELVLFRSIGGDWMVR